MSSIKLTYLPIRYLGETARLILHYAGEEFEDERCGFDTWVAVKEASIYKSLPFMVVNGKQIGQSMTINRYLAKKFNLTGKNDMEDAHINDVAEYFREMMYKTLPYTIFVNRGTGEGTKEQIYAKYLEPNINQYFPVIVKLLKQSKNNDFFADNGLTWVDFFISEYVDSIRNDAPELAEKYPELLEHSKKVHSLPELQNYLKTRKHTNW